ncbi:MAG: CBS domain-containing protein [Deltaproteobacteria bacterium]|nr:CBS domain-containing protein [Deltaproteobacteria bacterium]
MSHTDSHSLTVITTHVNADFDAMASAVAASKLYANSVIVLPGSQEKGLRDFLAGHSNAVRCQAALKDIDLNAVGLLVVVDTRQKDRIGVFADLLNRDGVEIHVYDHHPPSPQDIQGHEMFSDDVGANTTIMVQYLMERNVVLEPDEATLMAAGIYEDTGFFGFNSTTAKDMRAAAWLLEQGASVQDVSHVLTKTLTPEHVGILDDLLTHASAYSIAGIPITIAKTSMNQYVEDFAVLAHEIMDMQKLPCIFLVGMMPEQTIVIGRSRDARVNVGDILRKLGGGGHASAASATLKGMPLHEAEEMLLQAVKTALGPEPLAMHLMSKPVISIPPETTLAAASELLTRYGITVLPVTQDGRMLGAISRRTVEKAISHGLADLPVTHYMTTDFEVVPPSAPLQRIKEIIVNSRQRFLPVVENGMLEGVITRTDLLQLFTNDPSLKPMPLLAEKTAHRNIWPLVQERCSKEVLNYLKTAGEVAQKLHYKAYAVGGFVRDILLDRPPLDVDIVIEGDGIQFAHAMAEVFHARVRPHAQFQTAVLVFPNGFKLDVATARWEYYEYPAALPTIELSSIKLDLYRRDFTINAMAIGLTPQEQGILLDYFGGQRDIKDKLIRVLHNLSIVEDPTRAFRAIRFETRYGFSMAKQTVKLIQNALSLQLFQGLSGKRILTELKLILEEADPRQAVRRMWDLGLLQLIHANLKLTDVEEQRLTAVYETLSWYELLFRLKKPRKWVVYLLALLESMKLKDAMTVPERLQITGAVKELCGSGLINAKKTLGMLIRRKNLRPSEIYLMLRGLSIEHLLYMLAVVGHEHVRQYISQYIMDIQDQHPLTTGDDLKAMGIAPGPVYKAILTRLLTARLDGEVADKEGELALVKREFSWSVPHSTAAVP